MLDELKISCRLDEDVVEISLEINNVKVYKDIPVNLFELAKSCQLEGEFYFFTCVCGEPQCAGIYSGAEVKQLPEAVVWNLDIDGTKQQFRFDPTLYQSTIDQVICQVKSLHINELGLIHLPILVQRWEDLLQLNTQVFSTRLSVPEKRIIAKSVELDSSNRHFTIAGMNFNVEELSLPESLKEQYKSWIKHAGYEDNETETAEFLEFVNQGRIFSLALKKYLRKQVRLKYRPPRLSPCQPDELIELFGFIK